jgi:hypothetical protein
VAMGTGFNFLYGTNRVVRAKKKNGNQYARITITCRLRPWSSGYDRRLPSDGPGFNSRRTHFLLCGGCCGKELRFIPRAFAQHGFYSVIG